MDLQLNGKVALVSGGSQGLGLATAIQLASEGAQVAILGRSEDNLEIARKQIEQQSGKHALAIVADVSKPDQIQEALGRTLERFGVVDILLANAGGPPMGTFDKLTDEQFYQAFDLNMMSTVRLIRGVLPSMRQQGGGRIGVIVSQSAKEPIPGLLLSNAMRPGIVGLAKTLSGELASEGILINCFAPGRIRTARVEWLDQNIAEQRGISTEMLEKQIALTIPQGRYGKPEEFGKVAAFYLSFANSYVTGQTICVDGGKIKSLW